MKITVCRCRECGSANIASLAWVCPNSYAGGVIRQLGINDFDWADRDECVVCDDCDSSSDYWDETELEGTVENGKALVKNDDGSLISIQDWCASHPSRLKEEGVYDYERDEEEDEEEEEDE